jgi:GMP synthase (glutamine-hydrolysing)
LGFCRFYHRLKRNGNCNNTTPAHRGSPGCPENIRKTLDRAAPSGSARCSGPRPALISPMTDTVLIIDFGSQVTQLIARRVREAGVYSEIVPFNRAEGARERLQPKAVILSGGPASVTESGSPRAPGWVFQSGLPILSICYGQQTTAVQLGGEVEGGHAAEFGRADVEIREKSALFEGVWEVGRRYPVWMSHGDRVTRLPSGFAVKATSENAPFAVATDEARRIYTTMFHPEVVHTPDGAKLISNFVHKVAGLPGDWTMAHFRSSEIAKIRAQVGKSRVISGLSGGVDSAVASVLIHEAIGDQLTCIFVDHGLLRKDEAEEVVSLFRGTYNIPLVHVDARERFLGALTGVTDPEKKRKTIGALFIEVFEAEAKKIGGAEFLAQGTLYPDVIESVSFTGGPSVTIKSHHNVGGLPERMNLKLVEPLRELFKDEVRALGRELGLPEAFIGRHPFPGPGLAIRCPGEITAEKLDILRKADAIYLDEIRKAGLYDTIWQAFAVLLPVRTVGVMGDARTYDHVCALRAVTSTDGMTADYFPFPHEVLGRTATRIINEVKGINRVVYDITSKPPGTIEWE